MSIASLLKLISSLREDGVSPRVIRQIISSIAAPLSDVFNNSLSNGIFPD